MAGENADAESQSDILKCHVCLATAELLYQFRESRKGAGWLALDEETADVMLQHRRDVLSQLAMTVEQWTINLQEWSISFI